MIELPSSSSPSSSSSSLPSFCPEKVNQASLSHRIFSQLIDRRPSTALEIDEMHEPTKREIRDNDNFDVLVRGPLSLDFFFNSLQLVFRDEKKREKVVRVFSAPRRLRHSRNALKRNL